MTINPLVAAAVPAGVAAVKLGQHVVENRPFRSFFSQLGASEDSLLETSQTTDTDELASFLQQVRGALSKAGIDTKLRFEISSDAGGNLIVGGNHPRQAEIEAALNQSEEVVTAFRHLTANAQPDSASAVEEDFAEHYARDPHAAAKGRPLVASTFSVAINGDKIEVA